jgi:hypothetical protein
VKEVEDSVIYSPNPDTQFVNAVTEYVGFRTPQFVSGLCQPLDPGNALRECAAISPLEVAKPIDDRDNTW